ncbi:MAG: exopolysaccharide Pel transporter PelG [Fibrobacteria bacterium]|nr:exopolysaccharide Pel transporter PelG [Fibrobacteria bacterium]
MAGIGFRLQKMLSEDTYSSTLKAYFYAAAVSSGPWLFTIISVGFIGLYTSLYLDLHTQFVFRSIVVYTYAFSLIVTGAFQMVITRYLSDRFFSLDADAALPTFMMVLVLSTFLQAVSAIAFYSFFDFSLKIKMAAILLYVVVSNIWLAMVFLTALRDFRGILISFLSGAAVSLLAGIVWGRFEGLLGLLMGYSVGQSLILLLLTRNIFHEFRYVKSLDREFFHYFKMYPQLIFIGLLYNLAIWIDKFIFWYCGPGEQVEGLLYLCRVYDSSMYIAFLSIIPSLSLFIIRIETSFYQYYRDFYGAITKKMPLSVIEDKKQQIFDSLYLSMQRFLKLQGFISLLIIIFAHFIIDFMNLEWRQVSILQIGVLGTFLHVLVLILSIIVLYFDFRNLCLGITLTFFLTNMVFTWITVQLGYAFYGYGYMFSCLVTLVVGFILFANKLKDLEYITFMKQPVMTTRRETAPERGN